MNDDNIEPRPTTGRSRKKQILRTPYTGGASLCMCSGCKNCDVVDGGSGMCVRDAVYLVGDDPVCRVCVASSKELR